MYSSILVMVPLYLMDLAQRFPLSCVVGSAGHSLEWELMGMGKYESYTLLIPQALKGTIFS